MEAAMRYGKLVLVTAVALLFWWLYMGNAKKEIQITKLTSTVSELASDNAQLKARVDSWKKLWMANGTASVEQQQGLKEQETIEKETLGELEKLPATTGAKNGETSLNDSLPDAVVRLLSDHCAKVRGKPCDNP